jgi:ribosomal protein S12 methylthiotransferase
MQVFWSKAAKQDRYDILMATQLPISEEHNERKIGRTIEVLCEGFDPVAEAHFGRSAADAPDIDGKVYFTAKKRIPEGKFVRVKITEALDYDLVGECE